MSRRAILPVLSALSVLAVGAPPSPAAADTPKWARLSWSTEDSTTTMAVTWNSDGGTQPSLVQYGKTPSLGEQASGTEFKANGELGYIHEVELWDLEPDTTYYYRVGNEGGWSSVYQLRTGPLPGCRPIRFVALGDGRSQDDAGPAHNWPDIFLEALGEDPDFVINTGDLVKEGDDTKQWRNWLKDTAPLLPEIPHMTSLGNHDDDKADGDLAAYNQTFQLPRNSATQTEDFYWFRYGDAIIASLSTATYADGTKPYEVQAQWLDQVFTENPATWRFVFFHHPPYTSHAEAFGLEFNHAPNELGQNAAFVPVFDKHHVDVVFTGHNHFYERFAPMAGGGGSPTGNPVSDPSQGTIYVITGGAGAFTYDEVDLGFVKIDPMKDLVCAFPNQAPGSQVCSGKHHFMSIGIDGGTLTAEVIATSAQNFTNDPTNIEIIDTFSITKAAPTPSGCGVDPLPPDGPDAGSTDPDTVGGGDAGSTDAGSWDAGEADADADQDHGDTESDPETNPPGAQDGDNMGGGRQGPDAGAGGAVDFGDTGAPTGGYGPGEGNGGTGGGGAQPGLSPDEPGPGGGGISPVPTPNATGSGSGAAAGGCGAAGGPSTAWAWALALALLAVRTLRSRRARPALVAVAALGCVPTTGGCNRAEPAAEQPAAPAQRRPAEPEGLIADEPAAPSPAVGVGSAVEAEPEAAAQAPKRPTLPGQDVRITSLGGTQLAATWAPAEGNAPIVILLHPMQGDRQEWAPVAPALLEGVRASVLAVDLRGHGESVKTPDGGEQTWRELGSQGWAAVVADVRAAVTWARMQVGDATRPVALVGADVSGSAALICASEDRSIAAVAIASPGLSYHGIEALPAASATKGRSLLFLAGADDKYAAHSARVLAAQAEGTAQVLDGRAEHGVALLASSSEAAASIGAWLRGALGAPAAAAAAPPPPAP